MILHKHHILPKHMGGNDDPSNIIELTIEDHAQAHYELWEKFGKKEDLLAYKGLLKLLSKKEILKEVCSHKGKDNPMYGKIGKLNPNYGKKRNQNSKNKISESLKKYSKNRTKEHIKNLNESLYSEKTNEKRTNSISRSWEVTDKNGYTELVHNIADWCRKNGFNKSSVSCAAKKGNIHKGYLFRKIG